MDVAGERSIKLSKSELNFCHLIAHFRTAQHNHDVFVAFKAERSIPICCRIKIRGIVLCELQT